MARLPLHQYTIRVTFSTGYRHTGKQNASSAALAISNYLKKLHEQHEVNGLTTIKSCSILDEPIECAKLKRMKPPMHKSKVYEYYTCGVDEKFYRHKKTGVKISVDEYINLEELISQE